MGSQHVRAQGPFIAASIAILAFLLIAGAVVAVGGRPFSIAMTGAAEIPGPGDQDGMGTANLELNQGQGTICYELSVSGIETATAAHIHEIDPNTGFGGIVVHLVAPTTGTSSACADVLPELIQKIRQHPENYYVNVHNDPFPDGALRGDLSK